MRTINKGEPVIKLGRSEATAVALIFIGSKAFLGYPRFIAENGLNAAWLIAFIGGLVSIGFWLIIASLLARFPGKSLLEINEIVLGPLLGLGINMLGLGYIIVSSSLLLRQFADAAIITALPGVPLGALSFLFLLTVVIAAYFGLEPISRNSFIALPFILAGVTGVLLSLYSYWDMKQLFPLLGSGLAPVLLHGFINSTAFGEVIILAILAPYFSFGPQTLKNIGLFSIGLVCMYFTAIAIIYLMVIPTPATVENLAPIYQLSRAIYLGRYYQRFESFFVLFWTYSAFLRLSIGFILVALIAKISLKLPYYRPLLPALSVLFISIALTPAGLADAAEFERYRYRFGGIITLVIPAGVWLIALLRRKGEKSD